MSVLAMIVGLVVATMGTAVQAMPLPSPSGEVVLTIRGDIEHPNVGDEARFDRAMLDRLPSRTIVTRTPGNPARAASRARSSRPCWRLWGPTAMK